MTLLAAHFTFANYLLAIALLVFVAVLIGGIAWGEIDRRRRGPGVIASIATLVEAGLLDSNAARRMRRDYLATGGRA